MTKETPSPGWNSYSSLVSQQLIWNYTRKVKSIGSKDFVIEWWISKGIQLDESN